MSTRIEVGDAVLVHVNDKSHSQRIGLVEYIGYFGGQTKRKYIGINLVDKIENGHNGTIHGVQRFKCPQGHGIYVGTKNIIKKLKTSELTAHMQQIVTVTTHMRQRLDEYVAALSQRDEYIETLKNTARQLRKQLNALNNDKLHSIRAPALPPVDKRNDAISIVKKNSFCKQKPKQLNFESIQKHSEYTKYKESPKPNDSITSSSEEYTDEDEEDGDDDEWYHEDDFEWVDDCDLSTSSIKTSLYSPPELSPSSIKYVNRNHDISPVPSVSPHLTPTIHRKYREKKRKKSNTVMMNNTIQNRKLYIPSPTHTSLPE